MYACRVETQETAQADRFRYWECSIFQSFQSPCCEQEVRDQYYYTAALIPFLSSSHSSFLISPSGHPKDHRTHLFLQICERADPHQCSLFYIYQAILSVGIGRLLCVHWSGSQSKSKVIIKKIHSQSNVFYLYGIDAVNYQIKSKIGMEDSLQLPDDTQFINVQNLLSPEPLIKDSRENTPPHSLAYSNSTCVKDKMGDIQMRSPLAFEANHSKGEYSPTRTGIIRVNNQNHQINYQKTVTNSPQRYEQEKLEEREQVSARGQYKKINPKPRPKVISNKATNVIMKTQNEPEKKKETSQKKEQEIQNQRQTISKGDNPIHKNRVKELEHALHMQTIISEQLRTKLSVLTSLLQSKAKDSGLEYFFTLKNSSKEMKNIDIFVEMNLLQKKLTQKSIFMDRQKNQIKQLQLQIERLKQKKPVERSPSVDLHNQIQKLVQEKDSLMNYIDEQKLSLRKKIEYIAQLEQEINRLGDKESHYTEVERPKLISQLGQLKQENNRLHGQLESVRMELNLMELNYRSEMENMQEKRKQVQNVLMTQERQLQMHQNSIPLTQVKSVSTVQTQKDDAQKEILLRQLTLLKDERDHYISQYRKRTADSAKLYALELKLAALQQHRLIS